LNEGDEIGIGCSTHGEMRNAYRILVGKHERDYLKDLGLDGRFILNCRPT
jgi:hypothetical protein